MKAFLFGVHHALPSVVLMTEEGKVVASHGGGDLEDAKYWFYHYKKNVGYEVEEIDQKITDKFLYEEDSTTDILPEGFKKAWELNQKLDV